jgi:hypothetical protein
MSDGLVTGKEEWGRNRRRDGGRAGVNRRR